MRNGMIGLVALVLASALGCATVGTKVDPTQTDRLTIGVSTRAEAVALLGTPAGIMEGAAGTTLTWVYAHGNALGHARSTVIALTFDAAGILTDKTRSQVDLR